VLRTFYQWSQECEKRADEPSDELSWTRGICFNGEGATPHFNKVTKEYVVSPHIHNDRTMPGGTRPARPEEIPGYKT